MALWDYTEPDEKEGLFSPPFSKSYWNETFPPCAYWEEQLQCGPVWCTTEQHPQWDMRFSYVTANNFCVFVQENSVADMCTQCPSSVRLRQYFTCMVLNTILQ